MSVARPVRNRRGRGIDFGLAEGFLIKKIEVFRGKDSHEITKRMKAEEDFPFQTHSLPKA